MCFRTRITLSRLPCFLGDEVIGELETFGQHSCGPDALVGIWPTRMMGV